MSKLIWVLWPAFLAAGAGEIVFFALINPQELYFLGKPVNYPPLATYSIGFLFFWGLCALSSLLTCFLQRTSVEVNGPSERS